MSIKSNFRLIGKVFYAFIFITSLLACRDKGPIEKTLPGQKEEVNINAKFTLLSPEQTGVNFTNRVKEDYTYNIYVYEYMYNGGGVAVGDVNGDGWPDLYFSATFGPNILYLNLGNFKFLNVTVPAGVAAPVGFKTGVAMGDINGDGRIDIYSCRTSKTDDHKNNHVFINMGNRMENGIAIPYFEDQSEKLGLADNSNSNHVCFIDYDRDGDLDIFILNHKLNFKEASTVRLRQLEDGTIKRITAPGSPYESNRLYRNDNGHFTDVTLASGVQSSAFGLSVTAADLNKDGWIDLYVCHDYIEPDMILINNHDGTFTDKYDEYLRHSSQNSMGSDIADINNDGLVDIMALDMKPEDPIRYKTLINVMQYDRYSLLEEHGYGRQVGRNVLQLNNGNNTFSDIGQYAGVAETDWSWGTLLADFDNDGWKDNFIANGYRKDVTNHDYLTHVWDSIERTGGFTSKRFPDINEVLKLIPEQKISNYLYINNQKLQFIDATKAAGMDQPSFSNGASYADLDRDGDLDLIVNNLTHPAFIYRNDITGRHWLQIDLEDKPGNKDGIGAVADLYAGGIHQHQMMMINKGFFSTSEPILHFGLGDAGVVDSVILQWPNGDKEIISNIKADTLIVWRRGMGSAYKEIAAAANTPLFANPGTVNGWIHQEDNYVDFKRERMLPYKLSFEGPCISAGDVNGDNRVDIFAGNGSGFAATLFLQSHESTFIQAPNNSFRPDSVHEDCGSVLEDFDGDGDLDLIVISGGNAFNLSDNAYLVRYYINDGTGSFTRAADFPQLKTNAGVVIAHDYDQDGDKDLFIGGRNTPGSYPKAAQSFILKNNKGIFQDVTKEVFPDFSHQGMITDMKAGDMDGDGTDELIIVGHWMPVSIFSYNGSRFVDKTESYGLSKYTGWWKTVTIADIDGDGDNDLIAGNLGLNHRMETSELYPLTLISNDFDGNGSHDPVLSFYHNGKLYPYAGRDAMIGQVPMLKKKYVRYKLYANSTVDEIFPKDKLNKSINLTANTLMTLCFINDQKKFVLKDLPYQVQFHPVYDILVKDFNGDGRKDILMAGNFLYSETETGEMDAGNGTLLIQNADKSFEFVPNTVHGFWAQKEVRELDIITLANGQEVIITANNKGPLEIHSITSSEKQVQ